MLKNTIQVGDPVAHRGIVVAPLFPLHDPVAEYAALDEAIAQGLRITEVDEAGTVPELVVENPLNERVLLYDGEELVGAKQNRHLRLMPPFRLAIPSRDDDSEASHQCCRDDAHLGCVHSGTVRAAPVGI